MMRPAPIMRIDELQELLDKANAELVKLEAENKRLKKTLKGYKEVLTPWPNCDAERKSQKG